MTLSKARNSAAAYLSDIYLELAQASGLLVMASYNWGEHRVIDRLNDMEALRDLEDSPTIRNYWNVYSNFNHRIPEETKDYVFKIFAAAVIGQDPEYFGFDFENPIADAIDSYYSF